MAGRSYKTEAVVLRSIRFGEADRVLHLYTSDRGRIGAVAKGVRKTKSRFGARLEPLSHVELVLHEGSGELQTVTGVSLVASHHETRESSYRLGAGLIAAGEVSAVEVAQAHLDRIAAVDQRVHAFLHVDTDGALAAAAGLKPSMCSSASAGWRLAARPMTTIRTPIAPSTPKRS